jgi:hypothetical protein
MPFVRYGRPGLLGTVARTAIVAGTATMTANAVNRRAAARATQQQAAAYRAEQEAVAYQAEQQAAAQRPAQSDDLVGRLTELAQLRDAGALSADEFEAAKRSLLGLAPTGG